MTLTGNTWMQMTGRLSTTRRSTGEASARRLQVTYDVLVPIFEGWRTDLTTCSKIYAQNRAYELRNRGARITDRYGRPVSF